MLFTLNEQVPVPYNGLPTLGKYDQEFSLGIAPFSEPGDPVLLDPCTPDYSEDNVWMIGVWGVQIVISYAPFNPILHGDSTVFPLCFNPLVGFNEEDLFVLKTARGGGFVSNCCPYDNDNPLFALIFKYAIPPFQFYGTTNLLTNYPKTLEFYMVGGFYSPFVFTENQTLGIGERVFRAVLKRQDYLASQKLLKSLC